MMYSKPWSEVKVGDSISLYENLEKFNKVVALSPTKSGKSMKYELDSGWKGTDRIHTKVYYKGGE